MILPLLSLQQNVKPCLWKTSIADKQAGFVVWVGEERKRGEKYGTSEY